MLRLTALLVLSLLFRFSATGQTSGWFFSLYTGKSVGGPTSSLKKAMREAGLGEDNSSSSNKSYPISRRGLPLLVKVGKMLKENRSVYIIVGRSAGGTVKGYKRTGSGDFFGIPFYYGYGLTIEYDILQFAAGYQYSFPDKKIKLGVGPSLYVLKYNKDQYPKEKRNTGLTPGVTLSSRLPLGKEKKLFGMELVVETNIAPPVTMKDYVIPRPDSNNIAESITVKPGSVNMIHGTIGVAFSFRQ